MKISWKLLLALTTYLISSSAHSQTWVVCDNCYTNSEFQQAAEIRHGSWNGFRQYAVVNSISEQFRWVDVTYTPPGQEPRSAEGNVPGPTSDLEGNFIHFTKNRPYIIIPRGDNDDRRETLSSGYFTQLYTPTVPEANQVKAIIRISSEAVLLNAPLGGLGSDSLQEGLFYLGVIDQLIRTHLNATSPGWQSSAIDPNLVQALLETLELVWGQGPTGCVIFQNGDSACFQVNVLAPGAARVIEGTARDVNGNSIAVSSPVPNGGGLHLNINPLGNGTIGWSPGGSGGFALWLVCTLVNGALVECHTQILPE